MNKAITFIVATLLSAPAWSDHGNEAEDHHAKPEMSHADMGHDHSDEHDHASHETESDAPHAPHDHSGANHSDMGHDAHGMTMANAGITHTDDIMTALTNGGEPVVVDVLGVVCDFCTTAMNKIFGKRDEVAALYVDLDKKTLSLVINEGASLSDKQIEKLAKKAGYRIAAIRRDSEAMGG